MGALVLPVMNAVMNVSLSTSDMFSKFYCERLGYEKIFVTEVGQCVDFQSW